ncbi:hypothetical protein F3I62_19095 [Pseudomonas sp. R-28-1W-6]|uniref:hypothetical protein n=1 Tax=Pseudomonas sp. R-28-1W-6 TaxID=2650101 RepID=UPI00136538B7|nr:hypothetical protein [Pseudomonas sp. R-28-1W-6]MWV14213.1 hypothetical protein [Pseudomonas sp. R-28-1W-6]
MKKQTPHLVAAMFIRDCLEKGLSPVPESRKVSFSSRAITTRVRHIIKKWEDRRNYVDSLDEASRASRKAFIDNLPVISGIAFERCLVGSPARIGYRLYCPETLYLLMDIQDNDIPDEYRRNESSKEQYAAFWSMVA